MRRLAIMSAFVLLATVSPAQPPAQSVGQISFANSGAREAQEAFQRGVAWLHNFQYPQAEKAFQQALAIDPGFVMAVWGEAMTHTHPVWMEQDAEKGRAALAKLGPTPAERLAKAETPRERGLLEAVEALYGEGTKEQRDFHYSARMEQLHRAHPKDVDIASLYALSLLGLAHQGRDYGLYMRSAAILEEFFPAYQEHPGVLHYLIHSYDDPTHAPLGLRAARLYGAIAPDSHHAQHMTSHIFIALQDWPATIAANIRAMEIVHRDNAAEDRPRALCGHYLEWLHYAYFQTNEIDKAEAIRSSCHRAAAEEIDGTGMRRPGQSHSYAEMRARSIVETGRVPTDAPLTVDPAKWPLPAFTIAYGDLLLARGKSSGLAAARSRLEAIASKAPRPTMHPLEVKRQAIVLLQAEGLQAIAAGRRDAGIATLEKAAEIERTMEVPFGPPLVEKPSYELLAEELLAAGRRNEAAEAFRQALKLAPGRRLSATQLAKLETGRTEAASAPAAPHKH